MTDAFVPASLLYDVATGSTHRHSAQRAKDIEVCETVESDIVREVRTDAWCSRNEVGYRAKKFSSVCVLQKIVHYLSDLEGVKAELHIDNEEMINRQNRLLLEPSSVSELLPGYTYGRKFEIYQLRDADAVSKNHPSYHPKVEGLVNNNEAWAWVDRHEITEQTDETLLNALH